MTDAPLGGGGFPGEHETLANEILLVQQRIERLDLDDEERRSMTRAIGRVVSWSRHDMAVARLLLRDLEVLCAGSEHGPGGSSEPPIR